MVKCLLSEVDKYCETPGNNIADIIIEFREFERKAVKGLQERFYKAHPYDYNAKMAMSTDISARKIRDICNKK